MLVRGELTKRIIGLPIEVHKQLGPGLLESIYEGCLCSEPADVGLPFQRQIKLPIRYRGRHFHRAKNISVST